MKTLSKWYKWILLAVMFQFAVLLYVNNVFLNTDAKVSVTSANVKAKPSTGNFEVPDSASDVSISYNAKFGAYLDNGELHIIDIGNDKDKKVAGTQSDKITFYRWLPDRDMVIYSSDTKDGQKGVIQISTFEADSETARDYPEISGLSSKSTVMDIELSPYTNVVYAQIKTSDTKSKIIRFNVMSQYASVMSIGSEAEIKECTYVNKLVYQNIGESIYIYDGMNKVKNRVHLDAERVRILGIDSDDTLYIGALDSSGKVTQIYHQKIDDKRLGDSWTKINLKQSALPEDIIISGTGNIYMDDKQENKIINMASDLKASYRGDFIEIIEGALVSRDGGKVYVTSLKEY